jgi:hypothetical protein
MIVFHSTRKDLIMLQSAEAFEAQSTASAHFNNVLYSHHTFHVGNWHHNIIVVDRVKTNFFKLNVHLIVVELNALLPCLMFKCEK